ncbi:MAG: hypothetical protein J7500_07195 [Sphingomonas sp.]|uniref:hypothetical protein n=1 Tax=Sphingomonas sp. TaxID=28214 RepID=UPI001B06A260|nr:hypothetical protein [Sphingomonas sp.]MBO9622481.1 hypothetical protein [Sphingomonas sp.]
MRETPGNERKQDERETLARDRQQPPEKEGRVDALAGREPDGIPMTGEEDPFAEVDTDGFTDIVAEFAASEREPKPK